MRRSALDQATMDAMYGTSSARRPIQGYLQDDPFAALIEHHNMNVEGGGTQFNSPSGTTSTLKTAIVDAPNGGYMVIPTILGGQEIPWKDAASLAIQSGKRWPQFKSINEADAADRAFHQRYWGEDSYPMSNAGFLSR